MTNVQVSLLHVQPFCDRKHDIDSILLTVFFLQGARTSRWRVGLVQRVLYRGQEFRVTGAETGQGVSRGPRRYAQPGWGRKRYVNRLPANFPPSKMELQ